MRSLIWKSLLTKYLTAMSKYVDRIMDEVYDNFDRHFNGDAEEITWFLEELINKLEDELDSFKYFKQDDND